MLSGTMAAFGRRCNEIQAELRNLKGDAPVLDTATLERLGEVWPELDTTDRQAAISVVAAGIEILPAKYRGGVFDPEMVRIAWQGQNSQNS